MTPDCAECERLLDVATRPEGPLTVEQLVELYDSHGLHPETVAAIVRATHGGA